MLPVVDVGPLLDPFSSPRTRQNVADEIGAACREIGFFYIINHGAPESHRTSLFSQARAFFDLPEERKMEIFIGESDHFSGYVPLGRELTNGLRDWHEALDLRTDLRVDRPGVIAQRPLLGLDQWASEPADLREVLQIHWQLMRNIGRSLTGGLALSLGLEEEFFEPLISEPICNMRALHYPALDLQDTSVGEGIGPHIDYGHLTILDQDGTSGLEVMHAFGEWVAAPHVPGAYLVNIGRVTQIWTNDRYKATQHRVRTVPHDRYSVPFFFNPNVDSVIRPLDICCSSSHPPLYEPYRHGEFMAERLHKAFGTIRSAVV